jgi:hypothetical protein
MKSIVSKILVAGTIIIGLSLSAQASTVPKMKSDTGKMSKMEMKKMDKMKMNKMKMDKKMMNKKMMMDKKLMKDTSKMQKM